METSRDMKQKTWSNIRQLDTKWDTWYKNIKQHWTTLSQQRTLTEEESKPLNVKVHGIVLRKKHCATKQALFRSANTTCAIFDLDTLLYWWVCASCGRSLGVTFYISLESLWNEDMLHGTAQVGFRLCGSSLRRDVVHFLRKTDTWVRKVSAVCCYTDFCLGLSVYDLL